MQYPSMLSVIAEFHETHIGMALAVPVAVAEVNEGLTLHSPCNLLHLLMLSGSGGAAVNYCDHKIKLTTSWPCYL